MTVTTDTTPAADFLMQFFPLQNCEYVYVYIRYYVCLCVYLCACNIPDLYHHVRTCRKSAILCGHVLLMVRQRKIKDSN